MRFGHLIERLNMSIVIVTFLSEGKSNFLPFWTDASKLTRSFSSHIEYTEVFNRSFWTAFLGLSPRKR